MFVKRCHISKIKVSAFLTLGIVLLGFPKVSYGVVGKAVGLGEFEEQDLNDFHGKLVAEEMLGESPCMGDGLVLSLFLAPERSRECLF